MLADYICVAAGQYVAGYLVLRGNSICYAWYLRNR